MISSEQVLFISFFVLCFLLGFFTLLLCVLIYLVGSWPRPRGKRSYWGLTIATFLYSIALTHFVIAFHQDYLLFAGEGWKDMKKCLLLGIVQISVDYLACVIADMLLVWRMWVIYNKDIKVVIVPALLVFGTALCSVGYIWATLHVFLNLKGLTVPDIWVLNYEYPIHPWCVARIALSTITNVVLTTAIGIKFIRHHRSMRLILGSTTFLFESIVMIESGAIYSLAWIVRFVLYLLDHYSVVIVADTIGQLACIVPTLIIVTITTGFSPISRPDFSDRLPNCTTKDTSVIVDTRMSSALYHTRGTSILDSKSEEVSGAADERVVDEKSADRSLQSDDSLPV
ncbi:hypothetical protein HGRIS_012196 [Hohenbuehelia grisea]|uniref:Uncharacterized protein n=1 Tax=Hohenbuehelia grisea TaxID=104357 RepID=A0ABR3IRK7_9AGAR